MRYCFSLSVFDHLHKARLINFSPLNRSRGFLNVCAKSLCWLVFCFSYRPHLWPVTPALLGGRRKGRRVGSAHVFIEMTSHQTGFVSSHHNKAFPLL